MRIRESLVALILPLTILYIVPVSGEDPAADKSKADYEKHFLEMMVHHHQGGVEMADLCQTKARHPELKPFCGTISSGQQKEAGVMQTWLASWYHGQGTMSREETDKMMAEHTEHMQRLNAAAGDQFDVTFLDIMTRHHQQAIPEAKGCSTRAPHQELQTLCNDMAGQQEKEVVQMQAWATEWGRNAVPGLKD